MNRLVELDRGAPRRGHMEEVCRGVRSTDRGRGTGRVEWGTAGGLGAGVRAGTGTGAGAGTGTGAAFLGRQYVRQYGDPNLMVLVLNPNFTSWSVSQGILRTTLYPPKWVTKKVNFSV